MEPTGEQVGPLRREAQSRRGGAAFPEKLILCRFHGLSGPGM